MSDNSYGAFARFYDLVNGETQYAKRTKYLLSLFKKFSHKPALLLDLACGTGDFSVLFSKNGCEVIAVDCSPDMLSVAREKADIQGQNVLFLNQRMEELELYGTVDGAVCCFDSVNHITDYSVLKSAFRKVSLYLENDCLFIFDVNTVHKHRDVLNGKTFVYDEPDVYFVWRNEYEEKNHLLNISLDMFAPNGELYMRNTENVVERAYTVDELYAAVAEAGLEVIAVYDDLSQAPPDENSQRIFFVTRKV